MKEKDYLVTFDDGSTLHVVATSKKEAKEKATKINRGKEGVFCVEDYYL